MSVTWDVDDQAQRLNRATASLAEWLAPLAFEGSYRTIGVDLLNLVRLVLGLEPLCTDHGIDRRASRAAVSRSTTGRDVAP